MQKLSIVSKSKFVAKVLRHQPQLIGIALDENGWAKVEELLQLSAKVCPLSMEDLETIVATDSKGRYTFNDDKTLVRARQGHSVRVDVGLVLATPPAVLYHGTAEKFVCSINQHGLVKKSRLHVHLSCNKQSAMEVGARHGTPFVFAVDAQSMAQDGFDFWLSENGVWLVDHVPPKYLSKA